MTCLLSVERSEIAKTPQELSYYVICIKQAKRCKMVCILQSYEPCRNPTDLSKQFENAIKHFSLRFFITIFDEASVNSVYHTERTQNILLQ